MQFGFVAIYLSESFIRGFMTAAGLQILISVLKYIFGLTIPSYAGPGSIVFTFIDICKNLPHTNVASLIFALISGVFLVLVKELNARYMHKIHFPIPTEMIVVRTSPGAGCRRPGWRGLEKRNPSPARAREPLPSLTALHCQPVEWEVRGKFLPFP